MKKEPVIYEALMDEKPLRISFPDKAETYGVGPCTGIALLNKKRRLGYLGHYSPWNKESEELIQQALREAQNPGDLELVLAGNITPPKEEAETPAIQEWITQRYEEHATWLTTIAKTTRITKIRNHLHTRPIPGSYYLMIDTTKKSIIVRREEEN